MITDIAISIWIQSIDVLLFLIPDFLNVPFDSAQAFILIGSYFAYFNFMFDIPLLLTCIIIVVSFDIALSVFSLSRWLINMIPFLNIRA